MRFGKWARLLLAATPFVAGCAGFWQSPNTATTSGCTTDCTTLSSGYFYILSAGTTPQVAGESIISGAMTNISGSPWTLPSAPFAMAISPSGSYLYVSTTGGVVMYPISSAELETKSSLTVSPDADAGAIAVDTSGKWLIEAEGGTNTVTLAAIPLNTSTGGDNGTEEVVNYSDSGAAVQDGKIAVSPDDNYVFVSLGAGGTLVAPFNAGVSVGSNPFSSTATVVPVAHTSGSALSVAVDPGGNLFYIGEALGDPTGATGGLRVFTLGSLGGTLVQATGSPIASGGLAPNAILPVGSAGSGYVYVANGEGTSSAGNITSFPITLSGSTYTVAKGSTTSAGIQPFSLAEDSSGDFVLDMNSLGDPDFASYTFDSTTAGLLDVQNTATTGASPLAVVAAPQ